MKITVALHRELEKQVLSGEISYSRMVEILNQQANKKSELGIRRIQQLAAKRNLMRLLRKLLTY